MTSGCCGSGTLAARSSELDILARPTSHIQALCLLPLLKQPFEQRSQTCFWPVQIQRFLEYWQQAQVGCPFLVGCIIGFSLAKLSQGGASNLRRGAKSPTKSVARAVTREGGSVGNVDDDDEETRVVGDEATRESGSVGDEATRVVGDRAMRESGSVGDEVIRVVGDRAMRESGSVGDEATRESSSVGDKVTGVVGDEATRESGSVGDEATRVVGNRAMRESGSVSDEAGEWQRRSDKGCRRRSDDGERQ